MGFLKMNIFSFVVLLGFLALVHPAQADGIGPGHWTSVSGGSKVSFKSIHKFHEIVGISTAAEGRAMVSPALIQVQVRIPMASFNSGSASRDSNVLSVADAARFPYVMLKGTAKPCELKAGECTLMLSSMLDFHGVSLPYEVPVHITESASKHLTANFELPVSLTKHNIELPSLLFVPIDDLMKVEGKIEMEPRS